MPDQFHERPERSVRAYRPTAYNDTKSHIESQRETTLIAHTYTAVRPIAFG